MNNAHPGLPEFEYVKPASLKEASKFLAEHAGEARPFSGGTDMFVRLRDGFFKETKFMVDVKGLDGTNEIMFDPKKGLTIGAAISMNRVVAHPEIQKVYPLLAEAARTVASFQLRSRATIVGNICNASPAGDTIGACLVYDGYLNVHGVDGFYTLPLDSFFKGPGKTTLKPGDVVVSVGFPIPAKDHAGRYIKLGRNRLSDLSVVGVTAFVSEDKTIPSGYRFRLALASVAPVPFVPAAAEKILAEKPFSEEVAAEAGQAAMDAITPIDDTRGSARYRKYMVRNLVRQALMDAWSRHNKA